MDINEKIRFFINEINKGPFYIKDNEKEFIAETIINNSKKHDDIYSCAVYQGYLDMHRTLSYPDEAKGKIGKHDRDKINESMKDLSTRIKEYFSNNDTVKTEKEFDKKYEYFLSAFDNANITIGQRQKVINMAFKYLYCLADLRETKREYFKYCHMPLDSYTLSWYKNACDKKLGDIKWSNLDNKQLYKDIVKKTREKLGTESVLVSEFQIWEQEKLLEVFKTLLSFSQSLENNPYYSNEYRVNIPSVESCNNKINKIKADLNYKNI